MKLISSITGTVLMRASSDEVCSAESILQRDIVEFVGAAYAFSIKPVIPPGVAPASIPVLNFQQGKLVTETAQYAIQQIAMFSNGDAITAASTDTAEIVLNDFTRRLDTGLGFRYGNKPWKRIYYSGLIVEFDPALEDRVAAFRTIEGIVSRAIPRAAGSFKPKTLTFGFGDPTNQITQMSVEVIENADFLLQRRVGEPYSANRYFSGAPLRTQDHVKMLEEIERAIS